MKEKREIFKKAKLPVHDLDIEYDEDISTKETKPHKKPATCDHERLPRKVVKHRHKDSKRTQDCSLIHKRRKTKEQPIETHVKNMSKIKERRSFINSKNRLTMGIYNQGKQSHTIYRESGMSKVFDKMSSKLKAKTKADMSKVLDCSSFQIKPLQGHIPETKFDDFNLLDPDSDPRPPSLNSDSSRHPEKNQMRGASSLSVSPYNCSVINGQRDVNAIPKTMELITSEPQLEDITHRLMNTLQPSRTFGKDHLQDIRNELKECYRKSTLKQAQGCTLLDTVNNPSVTPVRIATLEDGGKKLFSSSISRIGSMSRNHSNPTEIFFQENCTCSKNSIKEGPLMIGMQVATEQQPGDVTEHERVDILSIIEDMHDGHNDFKFASISPLKKPSLDIPSPQKLLPRKLF